MGRLSVVAALALATLVVDAATAGALPPPVRHCGTVARRVPLKPARLDVIGGGPPASCRTARRVMGRFRRTFAHDVLGWTCTASYTEKDGTFVLGRCTRDLGTSVAQFIMLYVSGPDREP
jgi:hypothetical protein